MNPEQYLRDFFNTERYELYPIPDEKIRSFLVYSIGKLISLFQSMTDYSSFVKTNGARLISQFNSQPSPSDYLRAQVFELLQDAVSPDEDDSIDNYNLYLICKTWHHNRVSSLIRSVAPPFPYSAIDRKYVEPDFSIGNHQLDPSFQMAFHDYLQAVDPVTSFKVQTIVTQTLSRYPPMALGFLELYNLLQQLR